MNTLKLGAVGNDVVTLQTLLEEWNYPCPQTGTFDKETDKCVREFQHSQGLTADGIVGKRTWEVLQNETLKALLPLKLCENDFVQAAQKMNVEVAAVKAVQDVETGGRGGFVKVAYPTILFEGHIFWNQLKKQDINPENFVSGNEDILYPNWTKKFYKGGEAEYSRLERAKKIHEVAALCSASWGMWQIMGFNYSSCKCENIHEFVALMNIKEGTQLNLFVNFVIANGWDKFLRNKDWAEFARRYNGPGYKENKYDEKLAEAYKKYLG